MIYIDLSQITAWYRDGHKLAGSEARQGGLGESVARLELGCITEAEAGQCQPIGSQFILCCQVSTSAGAKPGARRSWSPPS